MSSSNRIRKFESGSQKRKKKQRIEKLTQSQKGSMDRFVIKESNVLSGNEQAEASNEVVDQGPALEDQGVPISTPKKNKVETKNLFTFHASAPTSQPRRPSAPPSRTVSFGSPGRLQSLNDRTQKLPVLFPFSPVEIHCRAAASTVRFPHLRRSALQRE
jgi:hypothetical protein